MNDKPERLQHATEYLLRAEDLSTDPRVKYQIRQARQLLVDADDDLRFIEP